MKRKIVSALLVMSMAASLVACGNSGSGSSDPADESVSVSSSASSESDASASASSESEAEAEESEMPEGYDETSTELYNEALGDFNDALATAKEAETVDERYALMAVAEGKLMESAMMYPLTSKGGTYAMYRMAPRTKDYTLWGSDQDRYHQYIVTTDFIKAEDYNEMRAKWDELKGTGTYESWVNNLSTEYYYRHPRSYKRRGIFSVDEPSPTIRGVNRPKPNNYKKHSGDLVSPDGVRNLTALERSLIQTFPPNFVWDDSSASTEQMIGNAVPVKLAHYVATCLMRFINGDTDLHNLRFIDWLKKEKTLSAEVAGDTLSRIGRARRILDFEDNDCETYLKKLNEENLFKGIVPSVRAQIRRAVRLYFEYVSNHTEVES